MYEFVYIRTKRNETFCGPPEGHFRECCQEGVRLRISQVAWGTEKKAGKPGIPAFLGEEGLTARKGVVRIEGLRAQS
jgi:hypothetical protein